MCTRNPLHPGLVDLSRATAGTVGRCSSRIAPCHWPLTTLHAGRAARMARCDQHPRHGLHSLHSAVCLGLRQPTKTGLGFLASWLLGLLLGVPPAPPARARTVAGRSPSHCKSRHAATHSETPPPKTLLETVKRIIAGCRSQRAHCRTPSKPPPSAADATPSSSPVVHLSLFPVLGR